LYKSSGFIRPLAVIVTMMTLVGCTRKPQVLNPARAPQIAMLESVAISSFDGKDGPLFKSELQSMLMSENKKQGIFMVMDSPQKAEGVFSGQVIESSVNNRTYSKEVEDCERKKLFGACKEGTKRKYNVQCLERTGTFQVVFSVKKVQTGEIIYTSTHAGNERDTYCQNQSSSPIPEAAILQKARAKALEKIRKDVAPYYTGGGLSFF